jgi:hypothetical protein
MKSINRTRFIVGSLVALVVVIALVLSRREGGGNVPTAHLSDTSPVGARGLGLVMERLGYTTQSATEPIRAMPRDARVWFLLDSQTRFSDREATLLLNWVRAGGILVCACPASDAPSFFGSTSSRPGLDQLNKSLGATTSGEPNFNPNGLPQMTPLSFESVSDYRTGVAGASTSGTELSVARPHLGIAGSRFSAGDAVARMDAGKGHIFLFPDAWMLCNYGLSKPANATFIANLIRVHNLNPNGGKAYFDERSHDNTLTPPTPDDWPARLRQRPVVFAVWQLLVVGLGCLALVSRRLGLPVGLPTQAPVTRASGFARAMGSLLFKAARPKAAAQIIGESFRARLARRVGLSPRESDEVLSLRAHEISGIPRETLSRALIASRAPATDETSALRDAQAMERILEQLG